MRMTTTVKILKDDKLWRKMYRNLNRPSSQDIVEVGWWGNVHPTGVPVAQVAKWNEEGHMTGWGGYSPPRPFLRVGAMGYIKRRIIPKYNNMVNDVAMGRLTWTAFNKNLSQDLKEAVQKSILEWQSPPNAPLTVRLKGHGEVLINTGTMYDRVKAKIVRGG